MTPREIKSPKENVAQNDLIVISDATIKIKQEIVKCVSQGLNIDETIKQINNIIASAMRQVSSKEVSKKIYTILVSNARNWFYYQIKNKNRLDEQLARDLTKQGVLRKSGENYLIQVPNGGSVITNINALFDGEFRPYLTSHTKAVILIEDYRKKVQALIKDMAVNPPKVTRYTTAGKPYKTSLRNIAEAQVRFEANQKDLEEARQNGVKLMWISSHVDASIRCAPDQGKLVSLDNTSGVIDGIRYVGIDTIVKPDRSSIITGYNCRHRLIEYFKGSRPPRDYDSEKISKERVINSKQRQYENKIRAYKEEEKLLRIAGFDDQASKIRKKWQGLTAQYEQFSLNNNRPVYRWRCVVDKEEMHALSLDTPGAPNSASIINPQPTNLNSKHYSNWTDLPNLNEVEKFVTNTLKIPYTDVTGMKLKIANEAVKGINSVITDYPEVVNVIPCFGNAYRVRKYLQQTKRITFTISHDTRGLYAPEVGVLLNKVRDVNALEKSLKDSVNFGWSAQGRECLESVAVHEMGHALDELLGLRTNQEMVKIFNNHGGTRLENDLSIYGATTIEEMIAEGFAEYRLNSNPRPIAMEIGLLIDKIYHSIY